MPTKSCLIGRRQGVAALRLGATNRLIQQYCPDILALARSPVDIPAVQLKPIRPSVNAVLDEVAQDFGLAPEQVLDRGSGRAFKNRIEPASHSQYDADEMCD